MSGGRDARRKGYFIQFENGVKQKMRGKKVVSFMETAEQKYVQQRITVVIHEGCLDVTCKYDMK